MPTSGGGSQGGGNGPSQPGPLGWNPSRRKMRQRWADGFAGLPAGLPPTGMSTMVIRRKELQRVVGHVLVGPSLPPASGPSVGFPAGFILRPVKSGRSSRRGLVRISGPVAIPVGPLFGRPSVVGRGVTAADRSRRNGRIWTPLFPLSSATPRFSLTPVVANRVAGRRRGGSVSFARFVLGTTPAVLLRRATIMPISRQGRSPRTVTKAWAPSLPGQFIQPLIPLSVRPALRRGDEWARRRPGRIWQAVRSPTAVRLG